MLSSTSSSPGPEATRTPVPVIAAYVAVGALPFSMLIFLPLFVGAMVTDLGFPERQTGFIASADSAGFVAGGLLAVCWVPSFNLRRIILGGLIAMAVLNAGCAFASDVESMMALRFVAGFAAATVSAGIVACIAGTPNPDRIYGLWMAGQLTYGTVGFLVAPALFGKWGVAAGFLAVAGLCALAVPLTRCLPARAKPDPAGSTSVASGGIRIALWSAIAGLFVFYVGLNVVWAFLERMGDSAGLSARTIGNGLAVANAAGLAGALLVSALGAAIGRIAPLSIGLVLTAAAILLLLGGRFGAFTYTVAASVYLAGWCFLVPLMLAAVSDSDPNGRFIAIGNAVIAIGLAGGAALGGLLVTGATYDPLIWAGALGISGSLLLLLPLLIAQQRS
ncbi:MAG: MFS transporter [Proteobacteria bacterium]|nr:MFS transporter [Pseudomonadota bacterium]